MVKTEQYNIWKYIPPYNVSKCIHMDVHSVSTKDSSSIYFSMWLYILIYDCYHIPQQLTVKHLDIWLCDTSEYIYISISIWLYSMSQYKTFPNFLSFFSKRNSHKEPSMHVYIYNYSRAVQSQNISCYHLARSHSTKLSHDFLHTTAYLLIQKTYMFI